jgi:hypothetical protein
MATTKATDDAPLPMREVAPSALTLAKDLGATIRVREGLGGKARVVMLGFAALS